MRLYLFWGNNYIQEITNVFVMFLQGLNGFIMMTTQTGKLLYISDNAAEYF